MIMREDAYGKMVGTAVSSAASPCTLQSMT